MSRGALTRLGLLGLIWGSSFLLIAYALEGVSPAQIVLGRLVVASVVLLAVAALRGVRLPREPRVWGHLAVMGMIANVVPFWLYGFAGQHIASGLAGVLNGTTPLFTLLATAAATRVGWAGDRLSGERVAGLALGFAGTVLVVAPWAPGALAGSRAGQLAALLASACYGFAFVYTRRFLTPTGYPPLALSAGQLTCAAAVLVLAAPLVARDPVTLSPAVLASVVALGAIHTGLAYQLYYRLIREAGATSASMVTYLLPVVAVVLGIGLRGEPLGWNVAAGTVVVLAGVALAEGRLRRRSRGSPVPEGAMT